MKLIHGDCLDALRTLPDHSVDAVVTDPPAGIFFMGRAWDGDKGGRDQWIAWLAERLTECLRVLKPGGHAVVWALPRTSGWTHRALEDAGFDVRDCVHHLFGSGFPKSANVSKLIDKAAGCEREIVGSYRVSGTAAKGGRQGRAAVAAEGESSVGLQRDLDVTAPATPAAQQWDGWGTALKPAVEHWWLARKPLDSTVAGTVTRWGTGALNIDGCRVAGTVPKVTRGAPGAVFSDDNYEWQAFGESTPHAAGRWPADVVLSHLSIDWYTAKRDIPADIIDSVHPNYGDIEEVRVLPGADLGDALRPKSTPVLLAGMCERCQAGRPHNAMGDDVVSAVRRDVRDVSGVGAERTSEVLLEGVSGQNSGCCPSPAWRSPHARDQSQDGQGQQDSGELVTVEGRPLQGSRLLARDGRPAARVDDPAGSSDDQQTVRAGASCRDGGGPQSAADASRGGPPSERGEAGQPAGEPGGSRTRQALAGAPRDREALRSVAGGGGVPACGERMLAVPAHCIRPGTEVLFEYLTSAECNGVCSPGCAVAELDRQSGTSRSTPSSLPRGRRPRGMGEAGERKGDPSPNGPTYGDTGCASRFFPTFKYQAKPSTREKSNGLDDRNTHPTVKPVELMRWLVRLVTPPGGTVLDPFAGSGSTLVAATLEGFDSIGMEYTAEYLPLIEGRVRWAEQRVVRAAPTLFGEGEAG